MSSCKIFLLLFVRFNVCYGLYSSYQSEAASIPPANTSGSQGKGGISSATIVAIVVSISVAVLIFSVSICCLRKRKWKRHDSVPEEKSASYISNWAPPQYDFITIKKATNKFSSANLVGEDDFADVYRGTLPNGQEIAVKRFKTRTSLEVFNNELEVYAKVHHRNLVTPVGFSVRGDEMILVYEYFSNPSLGQILSIMFPVDETERDPVLAGTLGYIAPDSFLDAKVSSKYDVYSFGVILTQIISGRDCVQGKQEEGTLIGYAWHLWMDGQALELLDPTIRESYNPNEVMRCIHIAMMCVQIHRADRPSMASVILMLENHLMTLPSPSPPDDLSS